MNDAIAKATAYEAMNAAHLAVFRAYLVKVKAGEGLAASSGTAWLRAFEAETYAMTTYIDARKTWEATVRAFIEKARAAA
jgi:hypothetical protein